MGTRIPIDESRRTLNLSGLGPPIQPEHPAPRSKHAKRKYSFAPRNEFFRHISYLDKDEAAKLDKLRDDLQQSIERVVRVQGAFVKALNKNAIGSNRIKHIIQAVGEVPFHCEFQRKIVDTGVRTILESRAINEKRIQEEQELEEANKRRKLHEANCISCISHFE
ncbi:hypothetical protein PINS_up020126 [Pythium insidiosum]|nr:hypothetical protein PINS_up020126 [Pythium insidiosum]